MSKILVLRSWPRTEAEGHPKAIDKIPLFMNDLFDYAGLAEYRRDIIHLDWDMAIAPEDLKRFADYAHEDRERCLVAPYRLYAGGMWGTTIRNHIGNPWAAFRYEADEQSKRVVTEDDEVADLWGFGMVYLPHKWIAAYVGTFPGVILDDIGFSGFYYRQVGPARLTWDIRPVHLNFPAIKEL